MTTFEWSPYLPQFWYIYLGLLGVFALTLAVFRRMRDFFWRAAFFFILIGVLLNPVILNEIRQGLPDKLVIILDDSPSQKLGGRDKVAEEALQYIQSTLAKKSNVEPVVIRSSTAQESESTNLFTLLRNNLSTIPMSQVAGTVLITDGQVHDVPKDLGALDRLGPFHAVLTGTRKEFDRKITVVAAPKYGVLNENVTVRVKVEEFGRSMNAPSTVTIKQDGQTEQVASLMPNEEREFSFRISHPGQNILEFVMPVEEGELSGGNNSAPVIVNGIRDRLRVLLVSGSPHMGERAWRNLLKSDPAIDLVHFTILRSPESMDATPPNQLSLIVFPVEELFEKKIKDFDLIVFDRYQAYNMVMQPSYFTNIANYIRQGGAFLMALGTAEAKQFGITGGSISAALDSQLPLVATGGETARLPFRPVLSTLGAQHPITADLMRQFREKKWGQWYAQAETMKQRGETLMTGIDGRPLLVIDKVAEGRAAVLASDNVWLWGKGIGGQSGPYTELLRNLAHWLMKEPELEDDFIKAEARGNTITVSERDLTPEEKTVMMTAPSGAQSLVKMTDKEPGWIRANVQAPDHGIYSFDNGLKKAFVVVGSARNEEFADVHTTEEKLKPVIHATGGGIVWFQENRDFALRDVSSNVRAMGGDDWIGMKRNSAYTIDNIESLALLPNALSLLIILLGAVWMWWRESGAK
ncbi:MAG TPA: hypothetical protein VEF76_06600 [Patescibacteria group bacterium]|nr:hypothetical protein [Patescibacteria group bacterium]